MMRWEASKALASALETKALAVSAPTGTDPSKMGTFSEIRSMPQRPLMVSTLVRNKLEQSAFGQPIEAVWPGDIAVHDFGAVTVFVGAGFPIKLRNVKAALIILDDWHLTKSHEYRAAHAACRDALAGRGRVEAARDAFVIFARSADILLEDIPELAIRDTRKTGFRKHAP